jgi:hypothetical protein
VLLLDAAPTRRPGDLDLRTFELRLLGDLDRAAEAKGEVEPAKASKPVRFVAVGTGVDDSPKGEATTGMVGKRDIWELAGDGEGDGDGPFENEASLELPPKIFCPFTEANGDDVAAYAMKPPWNERFK